MKDLKPFNGKHCQMMETIEVIHFYPKKCHFTTKFFFFLCSKIATKLTSSLSIHPLLVYLAKSKLCTSTEILILALVRCLIAILLLLIAIIINSQWTGCNGFLLLSTNIHHCLTNRSYSEQGVSLHALALSVN